MAIGTRLSSIIQDAMRTIWLSRGETNPVSNSAIQNGIYAFRNNVFYKGVISFGRLHFIPFLFAFGLVWCALSAASHLVFNVADSMGAFCSGTPAAQLVAADKGIPQDTRQAFDTSVLCFPTGLTVKSGYEYEIVITVTKPWMDMDIETTPVGYRTSTRPMSQRLVLYSGILLRRIMFRPWFRLIARVGETGVDEYFLDPNKVSEAAAFTPVYKARFTAERAGELFLYVNDAVIGFPWTTSYFYKNNSGTARISVRLL
jgi:hypothetical protein